MKESKLESMLMWFGWHSARVIGKGAPWIAGVFFIWVAIQIIFKL